MLPSSYYLVYYPYGIIYHVVFIGLFTIIHESETEQRAQSIHRNYK